MPLTQRQIQIIGECLAAAAYGPFFPDGEFESVFGLSRAQVAEIADQWPVAIGSQENLDLAIHASFNNLTGYPIKKVNMEHWEDYISTDREGLINVFNTWRATR